MPKPTHEQGLSKAIYIKQRKQESGYILFLCLKQIKSYGYG